eukprot:gene23220-9536_t
MEGHAEISPNKRRRTLTGGEICTMAQEGARKVKGRSGNIVVCCRKRPLNTQDHDQTDIVSIRENKVVLSQE